MKVNATIPHSAFTPSGTGKENYKIWRDKRVNGMWHLSFYPDSNVNATIEIVMDGRTAINLADDLATALGATEINHWPSEMEQYP